MNLRSLIVLSLLFAIPAFVSRLILSSHSGEMRVAVVSHGFNPQYSPESHSAFFSMPPTVSAWLVPDSNPGWIGINTREDNGIYHPDHRAMFHPANIHPDMLNFVLPDTPDEDFSEIYINGVPAEVSLGNAGPSLHNSPLDQGFIASRYPSDVYFGNIGPGGILGESRGVTPAPEPRNCGLLGLALVGIGLLRKRVRK